MMPFGNMPEAPEGPDDSLMLETLADILKNGGKIPTEPGFVLRLTLAGVREVYRSSSRNQNQLRRQWAAIVVLFGAVAGSAAVTAVTHGNIWEAIRSLQAALLP
jgi:hypothetical protein